MKRNFLFFSSWILILTLVSCSPRGKFLVSSDYQNTQILDKLYVAVIGSAETSECFDYLEDYLKDSLTNHGLVVDSKYYCCRNKSTNMGQVINEMIPSTFHEDNILIVAITKEIIGYGATSSRELEVSLFNTKEKKMTWSAKIRVNFEWFISDENYKDVARKINQMIIKELISKVIIRP